MRIDYVEQFNTNYGSTSGKNVMLTLHIPVIANPKPEVSDIFWTGPIVNRIQSTIHPRDVMYKHWIATSVPLYSDQYFGNYTMIYKNVDFLTITIEAKGVFLFCIISLNYYKHAMKYLNYISLRLE